MQGEQIVVRDTRVKSHFVVDDEYLNGYARLCGIFATGVYLSLCRHANSDQTCWPSLEKMAEELNINRRSVTKGIKCLKEWGIIQLSEPKKEKGKYVVTTYTLVDKSMWKSKPCAPDTHGTVCTPGTEPCAPQVENHVHRVHSKDSHLRIPNEGSNSFSKIGDNMGKRKPYIEGDLAWNDPTDSSKWRVRNHLGEWVDYIGNVKENLEWR